MAFKLGSNKGLQAEGGNIKSKFKFKTEKEVIPGTPVFKKDLGEGILAEANMDGSIYISKNLRPDDPMLAQAMRHEMQHITAMKIGHETYDDNAVYYKGETWKRVNGFIIDPHTGKKYQEGSRELPWEANKIQIMAFKMKSLTALFGNKELRKAKRAARKKLRKKGKLTKEARKEIRKYTDY